MAPPVSSSSLKPYLGAVGPSPAPRPAPALRALPRPDPNPKRESEPGWAVTDDMIELDVTPDREVPVPILQPSVFGREAANDCVPWEPSLIVPITTGERTALKMTDEARMRRAHLAKYVKAVVAACAMLCVAAVVRRGVSATSQEPLAAVSQASTVLPPVLPEALPPPAPTAQASAPTTGAHPVPPIKSSAKPKRLPR